MPLNGVRWSALFSRVFAPNRLVGPKVEADILQRSLIVMLPLVAKCCNKQSDYEMPPQSSHSTEWIGTRSAYEAWYGYWCICIVCGYSSCYAMHSSLKRIRVVIFSRKCLLHPTKQGSSTRERLVFNQTEWLSSLNCDSNIIMMNHCRKTPSSTDRYESFVVEGRVSLQHPPLKLIDNPR